MERGAGDVEWEPPRPTTTAAGDTTPAQSVLERHRVEERYLVLNPLIYE